MVEVIYVIYLKNKLYLYLPFKSKRLSSFSAMSLDLLLPESTERFPHVVMPVHRRLPQGSSADTHGLRLSRLPHEANFDHSRFSGDSLT